MLSDSILIGLMGLFLLVAGLYLIFSEILSDNCNDNSIHPTEVFNPMKRERSRLGFFLGMIGIAVLVFAFLI